MRWKKMGANPVARAHAMARLRFRSLRRHDPDQVLRVTAPASARPNLSPLAGHPSVGQTLGLRQVAVNGVGATSAGPGILPYRDAR